MLAPLITGALENVLTPPTVCVVVKSTNELDPPLNALVGIVPAAMFAPLMMGAFDPKLMIWMLDEIEYLYNTTAIVGKYALRPSPLMYAQDVVDPTG